MDGVSGNSLCGKVIAVTGSASGLGAAIAAACVAQGARVIGIDVKPSGLQEHRVVDVSDEDRMRHVFADLAGLDGLVNSAGIARRAKAADTTLEDFDAVMRVNLRGSLIAAKLAVPLMRGHGGSILHIASAVGLTGFRNRAAYSASKGAIVALTRNMALDYAGDRIRVNCLCPGFVKTPLLDAILADPARTERLTAMHPLGRLGEPQDIAHAAIFLLSDMASWITGQAIAVDGGLSAGHMVDV